MYDPAAAADWLEAAEERLWEKIDDAFIEYLNSGDVGFVAIASAHVSRLTLATGSKLVTGTVADLLRLGTFDPDDTSAWGITKGVASNALRVLAVVGPAGKAVGFAGRYAGLLGASRLTAITETAGPCGAQSLMNVFSLLKGKTKQLFSTGDDLYRAFLTSEPGTSTILGSATLRQLCRRFGIEMRQIGAINSVDDAVKAAKASGNPVTFTIEFVERTGTSAAHRLTAFRDHLGRVRIMDYFDGAAPGFKGYDSLKAWESAFGARAGSARLRTASPVVEWFSTSVGDKLRLLFEGRTFFIGVPIVVGVRPREGVFGLIAKLIDWFADEHPQDALPELTFTPPPEYTKTILVPQKPPYWYVVREGAPKEDWPSSRAGKAYGDTLLWPLILEGTQAEQKKAGKVTWFDQNKIVAGQRIFVPDISGYSRQKIAAAKKRGADWKRVG